MNRHEIEEEASERPLFRTEREPILNVGHLITLGLATIVNGVVVAFSVGSLYQRVDNNSDAVESLRTIAQGITPGAERRISVLEAQMMQMRSDVIDWRRDFREQLDRIEGKVDALQAGRAK